MCFLFFNAAVLYVKAHVNGQYVTIINKVLRVPYLSQVVLICKASGKVSWIYRQTKLKNHPQVILDSSRNSVGKILKITSFSKRVVGFDTCKNVYGIYELEESILITNCEWTL